MNYKKPNISKDAFIAKETVIIGDVSIEEESTILFFSVLRAEGNNSIRIGKRSNIQENCTLHVDEDDSVDIGDGVTIGHNCIIHGCTIGDGSLIGMGSVVMNGAKIGKRCLIGAGSLVTENTEIPDGMLALGSPARVKRPLTQEEFVYIADSEAEYVNVGKMLQEDHIID